MKFTLSLLSALVLTFACAAAEPAKVGDTAPDFTLNTLDGQAVKLSAENATQPVVLVMLRGWPGYQCPLCTRQVHDFVANAENFSGKARVIMVYPGPATNLAAHAEAFLKDAQWPKDFLFVTDPDYSFTKSYGLRWEAPGETSYPSTFVIAAGCELGHQLGGVVAERGGAGESHVWFRHEPLRPHGGGGTSHQCGRHQHQTHSQCEKNSAPVALVLFPISRSGIIYRINFSLHACVSGRTKDSLQAPC